MALVIKPGIYVSRISIKLIRRTSGLYLTKQKERPGVRPEGLIQHLDHVMMIRCIAGDTWPAVEPTSIIFDPVVAVVRILTLVLYRFLSRLF